jgi:hypothetical protein
MLKSPLILVIIIIIITMARQPYMGLGLLFPRLRGLCAFAAVSDRPTAASHILITNKIIPFVT